MFVLQVLLSPLLMGAVCAATLLSIVSAPLRPLTAECETEAETDHSVAESVDWLSHTTRTWLPQPGQRRSNRQRITSARLSSSAAISNATDGHRLPNGLNAPLTC
ncbi:MAG: hypothetical protein KDA96_08420 [Planctomycetaceae bacterium]|nr:hypothetical protein [Planctomycetaceae bacterium]